MLLETKNVPNLQNTIQKGDGKVNMQLNSAINLLRSDNQSLHNLKFEDDLKKNVLTSPAAHITISPFPGQHL